MSLANKKTRVNLYKETFLKWSSEYRLSYFQRISLEMATAFNKFIIDPTPDTLQKISESIGDIETMIEVHKIAFNGAQSQINEIKRHKLKALIESLNETKEKAE